MIESIRTRYARLLEIRVLHHFWLDEGTTVFDAIADPTVRAKRLLTYDARRLLAVRPSTATAEKLAGLRGVFRTTGPGFLAAIPDDALVPLDLMLEFFVTVVTPDYANYTALTLRPQEIVHVVEPTAAGEVIHRYKSNVPVLSNLTGTLRGGVGTAQHLYLSREYVNEAGDGVEALVVSGNDLHLLTGDPPDPPIHVLGPTPDYPVYVHQGDVPAITPLPGSTGTPDRGVELALDTPWAVAAIIRLSPRRPDDDAFSFANADGSLRTPAPVFEVHLRNRWTTWRYRNRVDGSVIATEGAPLPLTHFGNPGDRQKPSSASVGVEYAPRSAKITSLVSDIYV